MPRPRKRVKLEGEELRYPGEVRPRNEDVCIGRDPEHANGSTEEYTESIERQIARFAPEFRDCILSLPRGYVSYSIFRRKTPAILVMKNLFDVQSEETGGPKGERQARVELAGLDGVDSLPGDIH